MAHLFRNLYPFFLTLLILSGFILLVFQNVNAFTSSATQDMTFSNVSVSKYFSIAFSSALSEGISFGTVSFLPSISINATQNYNNTDNGTFYFVNVSTDSNTIVDLCTKTSGSMENSGGDVILLANETYSNSTINSASLPSTLETSLTTSYFKSGQNISIGGSNYYRFWLDIPAGQPSGTYNNTISFKGVEWGFDC